MSPLEIILDWDNLLKYLSFDDKGLGQSVGFFEMSRSSFKTVRYVTTKPTSEEVGIQAHYFLYQSVYLYCYQIGARRHCYRGYEGCRCVYRWWVECNSLCRWYIAVSGMFLVIICMI